MRLKVETVDVVLQRAFRSGVLPDQAKAGGLMGEARNAERP
jgi:hypothetical protein